MRRSLEKISPAPYGWLVWSGGVRQIATVLRFVAYAALTAGIFMLGRMS